MEIARGGGTMCCMDVDYEAGVIPAETLGDRLERALKHAKVGVQEMADHLGLSRNQTGRYINDRTPVPKAVLRVWALRCGVPYTWLVTGQGPSTGDSANGRVGDTWRYLQSEFGVSRQFTFAASDALPHPALAS